MDPASVDLRSISCNGIKSFNLFQKPSTFAVVSVVDPSNPSLNQKRKTAADTDGGENPEWAESFRFDLHGGDLSLDIEIMVQGNVPLLLGERVVGRVHVSIADLLTEGRDGSVRHVSYRVVGTDGKPNGVIRFSYKINYPAVAAGSFPPPHQLDPVVPAPAGSYYPPPEPMVPLAASGYYLSTSQLYPVISSPVRDCYPPPREQEPAIAFPATNYCFQPRQLVSPPVGDYYPPPRQWEGVVGAVSCYPPAGEHWAYPTPSSATSAREQEPVSDCYPPAREQEPAIAFPATNYCFQPRQLVSSPGGDYYPSPRQWEGVGGAVSCHPPAGEHWAYPTPSAPPECCYRHPQQASYYPAPPQRDGHGYRPDRWDRSLY